MLSVTRCLRHRLTILLAVVLSTSSILEVLVVECRSIDADHHAYEMVGHAEVVVGCSGVAQHEDGCTSDHGHHPSDCTDTDVDTDAVHVRSGWDAPVDGDKVLATVPRWTRPDLRVVDARHEPHRCPRPPPQVLRAADAFLAQRLLI